jgi:hypothetical protein
MVLWLVFRVSKTAGAGPALPALVGGWREWRRISEIGLVAMYRTNFAMGFVHRTCLESFSSVASFGLPG